MIKLSKELDYTIQFLIALSRQEENAPLSVRKFSKNTTISFLFLQRIAGKLREAEIVKSTKGVNGGYVLLKQLNELTLKDISEIIDGEQSIVECFKYNRNCKMVAECQTISVFQKINIDILNYLSSVTIDKYVA
ncbi:MAG: Rrf2 family transcriptional regulator [Candidatus Magasanikbacteria bacterium]|nr:Rrf2 family transcriptional regulator [Candidatus Magasanikbacteria bacterium]